MIAQGGLGVGVSVQDLPVALRKSLRRPRLVVLVAANWPVAGMSGTDLNALTTELLATGVQAVVIWRSAEFGVTLDNVFPPPLTTFVQRVIRGAPIDVAYAEMYRSIGTLQPRVETPTLSVRSGTSRLFGETSPAVLIPPPPSDFIPRPRLLERLVTALLQPGARTVALTGLAGAGKTTLAQAAVNDARVLAEFPDVRLWATLGGSGPSFTDQLVSWTVALGGDPGGITDQRELSATIAVLIRDRRALLIVDDADDFSRAEPFLIDLDGCVRLVIARAGADLPPDAARLDVGGFEPDEALDLLTEGLEEVADRAMFEPLAARLEGWPLVVRLVNGLLRERVLVRGQPIGDALASVKTSLSRTGVAGVEPLGTGPTLGSALEASLAGLSPDEVQRLEELVIFPTGVEVPLTSVGHLWAATAGMDASRTFSLASRLRDRSLVHLTDSQPSPATSLRMHPVLRDYVAPRVADQLSSLHRAYLNVAAPRLTQTLAESLPNLAADLDPYLRGHLIDHLIGAGLTSVLGGTVFSNGLIGWTGQPVERPQGVYEVARRALTEFERLSREERRAIRAPRIESVGRGHYRDRTTADWGVVFGDDKNASIIHDALRPLLVYRRSFMSTGLSVYHVSAGESAQAFIERTASKEPLPYYLLIAADPRFISFEFQSELNMSGYATGRVSFERPDHYAHYAEKLVAYEKSRETPVGEAVLWSAEAPEDQEGLISANLFVQPLAERVDFASFGARVVRGSDARRSDLLAALLERKSLLVLFTALHTLVHPELKGVAVAGHNPLHGSLLVEPWALRGTPPAAALLSADDLTTGAEVGRLVHYAFGSYSAAFVSEPSSDWPIVSRLAQRMLAAGALAFIGHFDVVRSYPFLETGGTQAQTRVLDPYARILHQLVRGVPVGHAMRDLYDSAAALAVSLVDDSEQVSYGRPPPSPQNLAQRWTAWRNARSAIVLGDPAARVALATPTVA